MSVYLVNHRYSDRIDNERFDFVAGQVVDLDDATAAKVERNSPGTLSPVGDEAEAVPLVPGEGGERVGADGDARGNADPAAVTEPVTEPDPTAPAVPAAEAGPKRRGRPPKHG